MGDHVSEIDADEDDQKELQKTSGGVSGVNAHVVYFPG
jgi:hypothetical protein